LLNFSSSLAEAWGADACRSPLQSVGDHCDRLDKFQLSFGQDLENLETGLESEDAEAVAMVAHRLKGASASVGAPCLCQRAAEIEQLGRCDRLTEAQEPMQHLRHEWSRFQDHVSSVWSSGVV